jgi:hypothetical protein
MHLRHYAGDILVTRLPMLPEDREVSVKTHSPWTSPWRVLTIGASAEAVRDAKIAALLR